MTKSKNITITINTANCGRFIRPDLILVGLGIDLAPRGPLAELVDTSKKPRATKSKNPKKTAKRSRGARR